MKFHNNDVQVNIPKPLFILTIGIQTVGAKCRIHRFCGANLRILKERFRKHFYINRTEAEPLAKMLKVQPERVLGWFMCERRQRKRGIFICVYV